jgi:long-chain acyl-CoA synthetase
MGMNVSQLLHAWALRDGARVALVAETSHHEPRPVSYAELDALCLRAAASYAAAGLAPGSAVALSADNGLGFVAAFFGALYQGLTVLPIPPMSAPPELRHRLVHGRAAALVTDLHAQPLGDAACADLPHVKRLSVEALGDGAPGHPGPRELPTDAVAMVLYTSGTTGTPKGALISHASLLSHTAALVHHTLRLDGASVVMGALPLTHSYGLRMTLLAPFYAGARVLLNRRFEAGQVLSRMAREGATWFPGVPTMFHSLAHTPKPSAPLALKSALSAGAPLPREVRVRAEAVLGAPVRQGFGLTEATFSTVASPDDPEGADSVGPPVFGVEVRIVDDAGEAVPTGQHGEVCVRGQNVMAGYLDDPEATRAALGTGFLRTGDVGFLDAAGRLTVVDRIKDMIIRGGFNVVPAEVEAVLVEHPAVREAVVVGTPDSHYGEEVVCVLVLRPGAQLDPAALFAHCRERLSRTKLPRRYAVLDALPVGPSGKVQRRVVRDRVQCADLPVTPFPTA